MELIQKYDALIDRYVAGKLSTDELSEFEQLLKSNADIEKEVNMRSELQAAIEASEIKSISNRLESLHATKQSEGKVVKLNTKASSPSWIKYVGLAAIFAGLLFVATKFMNTTEVSPAEHFASYYQSLPMELSGRGSSEETINALETKYRGNDYAASIPLLTELLSQQENAKWSFYRGISYLETNNLNNAIADFKSVADSEDILWKQHGTWYLALSHLKNNNVDAAKNALQTLASNPDADHHREAKELLNKL